MATIFAQRLQCLSKGEVLDVSNLNPLKGSGTRIRTLPTRGKFAEIAQVYRQTPLRIYSVTREGLQAAEQLLSPQLKAEWAEYIQIVYDYFDSVDQEVEDEPLDFPDLGMHRMKRIFLNADDKESIFPDIFAFEDYPQEDYDLLGTYFTGVEFYLRLAAWIYHKYFFLRGQPKAVNRLMKCLAEDKDPCAILIQVTSYLRAEDMIYAWYHHFDPEKADFEYIKAVRGSYPDKDELFYRLYLEYIGDDTELMPLWFNVTQ